jgi:hypothetical protein
MDMLVNIEYLPDMLPDKLGPAQEVLSQRDPFGTDKLTTLPPCDGLSREGWRFPGFTNCLAWSATKAPFIKPKA